VATHLICAKPSGDKYDAAISHNKQNMSRQIHIVSEDWIFDCLRSWSRADETLYALPSPKYNDHCSPRLPCPHMSQLQVGPVEDDDAVAKGVETAISDKNSPAEHMVSTLRPRISSAMLTPQLSQCSRPVFLFAGRSEKKYRALENEARAVIYRLGGTITSIGEGVVARTPDTGPRSHSLTDTPTTEAHSNAAALVNSSKYDPRCTHLIIWELKRTEKFLCACAAGKVCFESFREVFEHD
jgi:hypothetical protein